MHESVHNEVGDRYTLERELGRGGMATVWLARDLRHERLVAIKIMHQELVGAFGVDRFLREVRLTARVQHPNILPIRGFAIADVARDSILQLALSAVTRALAADSGSADVWTTQEGLALTIEWGGVAQVQDVVALSIRDDKLALPDEHLSSAHG